MIQFGAQEILHTKDRPGYERRPGRPDGRLPASARTRSVPRSGRGRYVPRDGRAVTASWPTTLRTS